MMPIQGKMKGKIEKKDVRPPRKAKQPGAEILTRLTDMLWKRQHGQQLFPVLLLREVRLLRESELKLQGQVAQLKQIPNARAADNDKASPTAPCGRDDSGSYGGENVIVTEPMSSVLGVVGEDSEGEENGDDDIRNVCSSHGATSSPHPNLRSHRTRPLMMVTILLS